MTVAVVGGTGNVGSSVVRQLREAGVEALALSRATLDLRAPTPVEADAAFLLWPFPTSAGAREAVAALRVERIVYLSAASAPDGVWGEVEAEVAAAGVRHTFLRAGGFAANTLGWADMIRRDGVVRWPYGAAARSLVHERDLAAVAVKALLEDGHDGQAYVLTGPEAVTQAEQVRLIGEAIGQPLRWEDLPVAEALPMLTQAFGDRAFAEGALAYWGSLVDSPEPVTDTVEKLLGRPALSFATWAHDHRAEFLER